MNATPNTRSPSNAVIADEVGAPDQDLPPIFFCQKILAICSTWKNWVVIWQDHTSKISPRHIKNLTSLIFDITPPQRISESWPKSSRPWEDFQTLPQWNR
jgi:hypothetical protein